MKLFFFIIPFLIACQKKDQGAAPSQPIPTLDTIVEKKETYLELTSNVRDDYGFIDGCDSLLFTSLSVVSGFEASLSAAEGRVGEDNLSGEWYRTPSHDCYRSGRSGSTISKDMFTGLFWGTWADRDVGRLNRIYDYGSSNGWIMGEGSLGRVLLTPSSVALLAKLIKHFGGADHEEERNYPVPFPKGLDGYEAHLQTLSILLHGEIDGKITKDMKKRLKEHWDRNPSNALFAAGFARYNDGAFGLAVELLANEQWWPSDRLPTSADRCEEYLFQREYGDDWEPCDEDITHSGSDYLFVAGLLEHWNGR